MKIYKFKCYRLSYNFKKSLHAPTSIDVAYLRFPVGKSAQGLNPKVTVKYSMNLSWEFSKSNVFARKIESRLICKCSPLLKHLQLQTE